MRKAGLARGLCTCPPGAGDVSELAASRSASDVTCRGEWITTSCRPTAGRRVKSPSRPSSGGHGPNAGNFFDTTRTRQPGASAARPGWPTANVSGGVSRSRPSQKGQPEGSRGGSTAAAAPGRRARPGAMTTQRPERASRRSSGYALESLSSRPAVASAPASEKRSQELEWKRQDHRRRPFRAHLDQRLEEPQLEGRRIDADDVGGVLQPLGCLKLALGCDHLRTPLALRLRLARHGALHPGRDLDVLDLDDRDLDPPGRRGVVDDLLEDRVDLVALGEKLVQLMLPEDAPERRLEICEVATMKFSTWTIARSGSTIRKYATAFTRTGTLSFVMTSCGGTFSVTVRRSTRTILSTIGMRRKRPGPFGGERRRPSRKITPRSYSRATRTDAERRSRRMTRTAATAMMAAFMRLLWRRVLPSYARRRSTPGERLRRLLSPT